MPGRRAPSGAVGLVGDDSEIGGGVGLARLDAGALELGAQGWRQRRAGHQRLVQRRDVGAGGARLVEHDLEEVRRAAIDAGPEMRDRRDELFGIAGTGGDHRAAERQRAAFEDPPAGRQVIGKAIDDDLARGDAGRGESLGRAPRIAAGGFRLVNSPGRSEQARERARRRRSETAERRLGGLQRGERRICARPE